MFFSCELSINETKCVLFGRNIVYWAIIINLWNMPKEKFHIEFVMGSASQASLWRMISRVDGLSQWFADEVEVDDEENLYTFYWENQLTKPKWCIRNQNLTYDTDGPMRTMKNTTLNLEFISLNCQESWLCR